MAITENKVITHYIADTTQEKAALDDLMRKIDQLKAKEKQAAQEREQHFDQLVLDMTRANRGVDDVTVAWDGWGKKSHSVKSGVEGATGAIGKMTAKLALANVVFGDLDRVSGLVVKGIGMLGHEMSSTAKATVDATAKGAQLGLVFGPLGAAIGAAGGALGEFTANLYDDGKHKLVIKSYEAMIDYSERLSDAYRQVGKAIDGWTSSVERLRNAQEQANRELLESATGSLATGQHATDERVRTLRVAYLTEKRFSERFGGGEPSDQQVIIARQLRDALTEQATAAKSYGSAVSKIKLEEQHRYDAIADLNRALADGVIKQSDYRKALAELNKEEAAAAAAAAKKARAESLKLAGRRAKDWTDQLVADLEGQGVGQFSAVESGITGYGGIDMSAFADQSAQIGGAFSRMNAQNYEAFRAPKQQTFLEGTFGKVDEFNAYAEAFNMLGGAVSSAMDAWVTGSMSAGQAIKKFIADALKGLASHMAIEALKHGAYAIGSAAFGDVRGAATHAAAAAAFGTVALAAAVAAKESGAGTTATAKPGGASAGAVSYGAGQGGGSGERVIVYAGSSFSDDTPRMRQIRATRLVEEAYGTSAGSNR